MDNYKDTFVTIIECELCNNIKITYTTFYIISTIIIMSLIMKSIDYIKDFNEKIIYLNDNNFKDTDKDDDSQFINDYDFNIDLNSSYDLDSSSFDEE